MKMKLIMENWNNYITEKRDFPALMNILSGERGNVYTVGMMTAENPQAQAATPADNKKYNEKLEKALKQMRLGYKKIRGKFGNAENSYLILNSSRSQMVILGKYFNQESVIWGKKKEKEKKFVFEYIECASGQTTNTRDIVIFDPDVQSREDYFSQAKKGSEKFVIPFFDDDYEIVTEWNHKKKI